LLQSGGRDPLAGHGAQGLHMDDLPRASGDPWALLTALWLLDDFSADNGATRLVPGSHLRPGPVPKGFTDPAARHPDQLVVQAPAGSLLLFNGHLWHAGTANASGARRRVLQVQLGGRERRRPGQPAGVPADVSPAVRRLLRDGEG
jgi:ectoine hydroxylase-related dioxygenase (phytanoyl-CoA dioxygenase family)